MVHGGEKGVVRSAARSASGFHTATFSAADMPADALAEAFENFIGEWLLPGNLEFLTSPDRIEASARAIVRRGGFRLATIKLSPFRLVQTDRHLNSPAVRTVVLHVATEGRCEIRQAGARVLVAPGDVVLREAGSESTIMSDTGYGVLISTVPVTHLGSAILERFGRAPFLFPADAPGRVALYDLLNTMMSVRRLSAASLYHFEEAVTGVLRYAAVSTARPDAATGGVRDKAVPNLLHIIDQSIRDPDFTLAALAARVGKSERWVRHLLSAEGIHFKQYIIRHRLELARRTLLDPAHRDRAILSIALDCGFNDQTQFNRSFAQYFGMPPGRFRREAERTGDGSFGIAASGNT